MTKKIYGFQALPIETTNTYDPATFKKPFTQFHALNLSVILPRAEDSFLGISCEPVIYFQEEINGTEYFRFAVKSQFGLDPIFDIAQRDKQIYALIQTSILNFNDILSISENLPDFESINVTFEEIDFETAKLAIEKSIFMNSAN